MLIRLSLATAAVIAAQPGPTSIAARPFVQQQSLATAALQARKQRMLAEGRDLLARAQLKGRKYAPAPGQPTKAEIDVSTVQMKSDLDSMSEMGETESLRLQMAMDRLSKMMSTLSNVLKKASDTDDAITNNMK